MEMGMVVRIIIGIGKDETPLLLQRRWWRRQPTNSPERCIIVRQSLGGEENGWAGGAARRTPCLVLANQTKNFQGAAEHESCFYGQINSATQFNSAIQDFDLGTLHCVALKMQREKENSSVQPKRL